MYTIIGSKSKLNIFLIFHTKNSIHGLKNHIYKIFISNCNKTINYSILSIWHHLVVSIEKFKLNTNRQLFNSNFCNESFNNLWLSCLAIFWKINNPNLGGWYAPPNEKKDNHKFHYISPRQFYWSTVFYTTIIKNLPIILCVCL